MFGVVTLDKYSLECHLSSIMLHKILGLKDVKRLNMVSNDHYVFTMLTMDVSPKVELKERGIKTV